MTAKTKSRDDAALKQAVLLAALPHAAFDGFSDKLLERAREEAGITKAEAARLFPHGPLSLVEEFSDWADTEMKARLAKKKMSALKIRERIKAAVMARIDVLRPHKEAARRAAAFLTLPPHAAAGAKLLYRTVDAMWRAAGDTSTDFNFYTKRAILAGVFSSTMLRWFNDSAKDETATESFLDHRIENVMQFEKFKAQVKERTKDLPSLASILGRFSAGKSSAKDA
jgi:ubiquinone biosynthesis protein COQ9